MQRILGFLILLKAIIPVLLIIIVLGSGMYIYWTLDRLISHTWTATSAKIDSAMVQIDSVKIEAGRILGQVREIQTETERYADEIEQAIEPLKKSLYGLQNSMKVVAQSLEAIFNSMIDTLNKSRFFKLKKMRLKHLFNIPAFLPTLPDIDLDIQPDFQAIEQLTLIVQESALEIETALGQLKSIFTFWWRVVKLCFVLISTWLIISAIGYLFRLLYVFVIQFL